MVASLALSLASKLTWSLAKIMLGIKGDMELGWDDGIMLGIKGGMDLGSNDGIKHGIKHGMELAKIALSR
eukprot:259687-Ditylum_brightwellii.AAC.1